MINVWQTLDLLAGNDFQRCIEGFTSVQYFLSNLSKRSNLNDDISVETKQTLENLKCDQKYTGDSADSSSGSGGGNGNKRNKKSVNKRNRSSNLFKSKNKKNRVENEFINIIDCSFEMSGKFRQLMGTNVVKLTDQNYMRELRQRLSDDYNQMMMKRIATREQKEIERERNLIIEGKCKSISSQELSSAGHRHLTFMNNNKRNHGNQRARIKTAHERNTERLKRIQLKWEKEYKKTKQQNEGVQKDELTDYEDYEDYDGEQKSETNGIITSSKKNLRLENCRTLLKSDSSSSLAKDDSEKFFDSSDIALASGKSNEDHISEQFKLQNIKGLLANVSERKSKNFIRGENSDNVDLKDDDERNVIKNANKINNIANCDQKDEIHIEDSGTSSSPTVPHFLPKVKINPALYGNKKIFELKEADNVNLLYRLAEEIILQDVDDIKIPEN